MLPAFFDSIVSLVVRTSTDLPPDVRAAMKAALGMEAAGTQSGQALAIIAQNIDLAADGRGGDLPGHGHAHLRGEGAGRRQPDRG
jgi:tartrate dehydratase alpha subunit/fumarate hydratase class I-like protein